MGPRKQKEAQIAAAKFASWENASAESRAHLQQISWGKTRQRPWSRVERASAAILAVVLIAIVLPLTAIALLCVALAASRSRRMLGRFYRLACLAADVAPFVLVLSVALLFFAYCPYAHPFQYGASRDDLIAATTVGHQLLWTVGLFVFDFLHVPGRYYFGVGLTGVLSLVVLFLI